MARDSNLGFMHSVDSGAANDSSADKAHGMVWGSHTLNRQGKGEARASHNRIYPKSNRNALRLPSHLPLMLIALLLGFMVLSSMSNAATCTAPSNIPAGYNSVCVVISNNQAQASTNPFPQLVNIPSYQYDDWEAPNLINVGFQYGNGIRIPDWMENNQSNTAINTTYWLSMNSIPPSGSETVYMIFAPIGTDLLVGGQGSGAACQLTGSNSLDNGNVVFRYYQNFCSSSINGALPAGYQTNGANAIVNFNTNFVSVLTTTGSNTFNGIYVSTPVGANVPGNTLDAYQQLPTSAGTNKATNIGFLVILTPTPSTTCNGGQFGIIQGTVHTALCADILYTGTALTDANNPHVYSTSYAGSNIIGLIDYNAFTSNKLAGANGRTHIDFLNVNWTTPVNTYWVRMRNNAPGNVMPSTSLVPIIPINIQNSTNTLAFSLPAGISYTNLPQCTANQLSGACQGTDNIISAANANQSITGPLFVYGNVVIPTSSNVVPNDYPIVATGNIVIAGRVKGAWLGNGAAQAANPLQGGSFNQSCAGSGGGGGTPGAGQGSQGGNTLAAGGAGGGPSANGGAGSSPTCPALTPTNTLFLLSALPIYLNGAGGGGGGNTNGGGGAGSGGCYFQGNNIVITGTIDVSGYSSNTGTAGAAGPGGGGGGICIFEYNSIFTPNAANIIHGGAGTGSSFVGGTGGSGNVIATQYSTAPLPTQYIPLKYTNSSSGIPGITYTFNIISNGQITTLSQNTNTLNVVLTNQIPVSNIYTINIIETGASSTFTISYNQSLNTRIMPGNLIFVAGTNTLCSTIYQKYPICAFYPYSNNIFSNKPSWWWVQSDTIPIFSNGTGSLYNLINFSNNNLTFTMQNRINLVYNSFIPQVVITLNGISNPITNTSITQQPFNIMLSNVLNASRRNIANFTIFSQTTFNAVNTILSTNVSGIFNTYNYGPITNTFSGYSNYFLSIRQSNYQNPNITLNLLNASASTPFFFASPNTYCPTTLSGNAVLIAPIGLVDTNGTRYNFYVSTSGGQTGVGDILRINEQKGTGQIQVQSYKIPNQIPFVLPLESTGQQYAYIVMSANCKSVYFHSGFSQPSTSGIFLTLNLTPSAVIYNTTNATASCRITNTIAGNYIISCFGADSNGLTSRYQLQIAKTTSVIGTTSQIVNQTFAGSSFAVTFNEPINSQYDYNIYAYQAATQGSGYVFGGHLNIQRVAVASSVLGFIAFLIMLVMILGGAATGKTVILMMLTMAGLFIVSLLIQVPLFVIVIFSVLGGFAIWWDRRNSG